MSDTPTPAVAGLLAEFTGPDELLHAASHVHQHGYHRTDAYAPFPLHGLAEALGRKPTPLPWIVLAGGLAGGCGIYALAWWVSIEAYPLNVGGRPLHSWPSFIPPTFEGTILGAALAAVIGALALSRLPKLHHPVFEIEDFRRASTDAFFLWISAKDPAFDLPQTRQTLEELRPVNVWEVPTDD